MLARMHASNTASLVDQRLSGRGMEDYQNAVARIRTKLGEGGKQVGSGADPALVLLSQIIEMLRSARLTINFKPSKWFRNDVKFEKYGGMFEIGYDHRSNYVLERDQAESNMFSYGDRKRLSEHAYRKTREELLRRRDELEPRLARHGIRIREDVLLDRSRTLTRQMARLKRQRAGAMGRTALDLSHVLDELERAVGRIQRRLRRPPDETAATIDPPPGIGPSGVG